MSIPKRHNKSARFFMATDGPRATDHQYIIHVLPPLFTARIIHQKNGTFDYEINFLEDPNLVKESELQNVIKRMHNWHIAYLANQTS